MKAVIPAAGFGTRFLPATKAQPKEMLPVYDKPTIQYVVEEAVKSGIDDILIITGRNKRSIEDHFDKSMELENTLKNADKHEQLQLVKNITDLADICYVRQKEQKGLGDAINCAKKHVCGEAFAVLLGDSISRYGIIDGIQVEENVFDIKKLVEKPSVENAPSNLAIMGRYVLTPDIFDKLDETEPGVGGEIQLTDALQKLDSIYGVTFEGKAYDIGNRMEWLKTSIEFAMDDEDSKREIKEFISNFI